ncbi:MAG: SRPBCC family protein [Gemmatimonadota bacterium]|nr:SRPBCC family protein [Gemmatimonadota bacterium]
MSNIRIEETFSVPAPVSEVWAALLEPARLVVCIPGAALEASEDDRTYAGTVKVKLGAVAISYRGTVTFEEVDTDRRFLKLSGKGSEKGGSGTVRMTMETTLVEGEGGGTVVSTAMDMQLAGKIVRFGRGMIHSVSQELFAEFTRCLTETLTPAPQASTAQDEPPPGPQASPSLLPVLWRGLMRWIRGMFGR